MKIWKKRPSQASSEKRSFLNFLSNKITFNGHYFKRYIKKSERYSKIHIELILQIQIAQIGLARFFFIWSYLSIYISK
jgi:hypothetical protein